MGYLRGGSRREPIRPSIRASAQDKVRLRTLNLHAEIAARSAIASSLSIEQHMRMLREMRDRAEAKRRELKRFYVKNPLMPRKAPWNGDVQAYMSPLPITSGLGVTRDLQRPLIAASVFFSF